MMVVMLCIGPNSTNLNINYVQFLVYQLYTTINLEEKTLGGQLRAFEYGTSMK